MAIFIFLFFLDGLILWFAARTDFKNTLERAHITLEKAAISLDERVKRTVKSTEAILDGRAVRIQEKGLKAIVSSKEEWERFQKAALGLPDAGSLWLLDEQANLLLDSIEYPSKKINFSEREYFAPQRDQGIEFYIGPVVKGKITKKYSFTISRRLADRNGNFMGIVLAAIETDDFTNFLRNIELGEGGTVTVFRTDGAMILRQPMQDEFLGKTFNHLILFSIPFDKEPSGIFETSAFDGIKRIVAYRKLEGLPLLVTSGIPVDSILKDWKSRLKVYSFIAVIAFFALLVFSYLVRRTTLKEEKEKSQELLEINQSLQRENDERKRAEEALNEAIMNAKREQNRLQAIMEALPVGVALVDADGGNAGSNQAYEQIWGFKRPTARSVEDYALYKAWWVDSGKVVQPEEWASARAIRSGETVVGQIMEIQRFDGSRAFIHNSASPIHDAERKVVGSAVSVMDITDLEQAKKDVKKSMERIDIISETASKFLFTDDPQQVLEALCKRVMEHLGCDVFFNFLTDEGKECLRLNSYAGIPEETAREIHFLEYGVAVCGCAAKDACRIVAENIPTTPDIRTDLVRSFGVKAYACHPLFAQGQVIGTLSFGTKSRTTFMEDELSLMKTVADQVATALERKRLLESEKKRAHELEMRVQERTAELEQAYEKLEKEVEDRTRIEDQLRQSQKMEAIGTLAGGIAHDFNNILAAIIGFAEMIEEDIPLGKPRVHHVQRVINAATRGRELVRQILAFSRKTGHARYLLSLSAIIKETAQLLRASIPTTINISLDVRANSDTILATPVEIQQILMNLATNAALSMEDKGGTIQISVKDIFIDSDSTLLEAEMVPGDYMQLVVSDTGAGMTKEVLERIFEPFFTTREVGRGTGMGLAVVYGIVKSLHGNIKVDSEPGVGTTFSVLFPKAIAGEEEEVRDSEQIPGSRGRILFIDDEEFLVEWGQALLERLGYEVTSLNNSIEALELFSSDPSRFDVVITDQTMPGATGLQLAGEFLKLRPSIPIILCTGHSDAVIQNGLKESGIQELLFKPLTRKVLAEAIHRALNKDGENEALRQ
jgi:PAS domain S-box-containing protein